MTHLYNKCLKCGNTDIDVDSYKCNWSECDSLEVEEIFSCNCNLCGKYSEVGNSELCECGGDFIEN